MANSPERGNASKPLSLHPLTLDQAMTALLAVDPDDLADDDEERQDMNQGRPALRGGFYWAGDPALRDTEGMVLFQHRPHWWQVRRWYNVTRLWLGMPHDPPTKRSGRPLRYWLF